MEISKMLTISTAHISTETAAKLDLTQEVNGDIGIVYFNKGDYGWFIWLSDDDFYYEDKKIPSDLLDVMKFAKNNGCSWLCLDCDGEILNCLKTFDW